MLPRALLLLSIVAGVLTRPVRVRAIASADTGMAGFSASVADDELRFHPTGRANEWMAYNRWQGLAGTIDPAGFSIRGPLPDTRWEQRLTLVGFGHDRSSMSAFPAGPVAAFEDGLRIGDRRMTVEYVHSPEGLRQNFHLGERPAGSGPLLVVVHCEGGLGPVQDNDRTLMFRDDQGAERFRYHDLKVWDADGTGLDAWFETVDGGFRIVVDDRAARYPIVIDPISNTANTLLTGAGGFEFGIAVGTAGDLNRDGYSDVVVGAWQASLGQATEGAAYVYYGSNTGIPLVASVVLQCDQAGAQMGCSVSTGGDINGDGYADLLVGARTWESVIAEVSEGAVFVYYGSATGVALTPSLTLQPDHANDNFGSNVACAGDINNDGYSDILVGAYLAEYPTYQEGAVWVYVGSAAGLNTTAVHRLERNTSAAHFGRSIAGAGDVNGDNYSDVVIGAPDWLNVNPDAGAAFVYYGSATNLGAGINPAPSLTLFGSTFTNGSFGWSVTCAGDVNADGFSDVAVGAYIDQNGQVQEGTVRVFHGAAGGLNTVPATIIESNQANAWMGRWVGTAGDMNGDGYGDLLIGVEQWTNPEALEGAGFLYLGSGAGVGTTASLVFELNAAGANVGSCIGTAGDVNGDGYSDMVVGARIYGLGGAAAVYHGGPYSVNPTSSRTWTGGVGGNHLGWSVANAGDVNGDGYADALVGAPDATGGQAGEGLVYFFPGSSTGVAPAPTVTLEANVANAQFGYSMGTAGDVNGDGYADVIVGAPQSGGTGQAYVYMGGPAGLSTVPAITFTGTAGSRLGASVATAGDINADGRSEVLIGAPDISTVYLHMGSPGGTSAVPANTLSVGPVGNLYGTSVATAGDVNGDGYSDIIVGASAHTNGQAGEGAAFVYHGAQAGLVTPYAIMLEGNLAGAAFGHSVSGAGDVNGNGYYEVVVGAPFWESGQLDEGGVFVYYGTAAGTTTTGSVTLQRNQIGMEFGYCVAEAGDVNGDGYADIVVGAPLSDAGHVDEGQSFVYRGSPTGPVTATPDIVEPNASNYRSGWGVSGGGDVDGDGYSDILIGAPQASPALAAEGVAYWYRGGLARGLSMYTRQYDADLITPMSTNSQDYLNPNYFGIGHRSRSPISRMRGMLRWEVVFEGQPFTGAPITNSLQSTAASAAWSDLGTAGLEIKELVLKIAGPIRFKWRVRVEYPTNKLLDGQRFSRWYYGFATGHGDIGVLPIELLDFTGEADGPANQLHWSTASENNSDRFEVQRATGSDFIAIGSVSAAGQSTTTLAYAFTDAHPLAGVNYYRLRMLDTDGAEQYSPVIAIVRDGIGAVAFPNPAQDELTLSWSAAAIINTVRVIDATGRMVVELPAAVDGNSLSLVVDRLPQGAYTALLLDLDGGALDRVPFVKR